MTSLADGPHTFDVKAKDQAGNVDETPAHRAFSVDTGAPETEILLGPDGPTSDADPTFALRADEVATFECSLDGAAFTPCASPVVLTGLADGNHAFGARATDLAGNTDPMPAMRSWTSDTAIHRPDAEVRTSTSSTFRGNGIYNLSGKGQRVSGPVAKGRSVRFVVRLGNDGTDSDTLRVQGIVAAADFDVTFSDGADITAAVVAGTYDVTLAPGAPVELTVKVTPEPDAEVGDVQRVKIVATSTHDPSNADAVRLQARLKT